MKETNEYKDTGWMNVQCTRNGNFMRSWNPIKPKTRHDGILIVRCRDGRERKEKTAAWLVARAWHPDWYEGCYVIQNDDNSICVEDLAITDESGFKAWRGKRVSKAQRKYMAEREDKAEGIFRPTGVKDLECTEDGKFRFQGRDINVQYQVDPLGRKRVALIQTMNERERKVYSAARLVAKTWSPSEYYSGCMVEFADGNKHNIHSENLILISEKEYFKRHAPKREKLTFEESKKMIDQSFKEMEMIKKYMDTGDFNQLNRYVEKELVPYLTEWLLKKNVGRATTSYIVQQSIGFMYERLYCNRPVFSMTGYCKRLARKYLKDKTFGRVENIPPENIERIVSLLNINSLCKKFKVSKIQK